MERARTTWTDERLDDLSNRVSDGFNRVDRHVDSLEAMMEARFDSVERRIDGLERLMIQFGGATMVAALATLLSVLATRG